MSMFVREHVREHVRGHVREHVRGHVREHAREHVREHVRGHVCVQCMFARMSGRTCTSCANLAWSAAPEGALIALSSWSFG